MLWQTETDEARNFDASTVCGGRVFFFPFGARFVGR